MPITPSHTPIILFQLLASPDVVDDVIHHIKTYEPTSTDLREAVRSVEAEMLSTHAAALVGNQVGHPLLRPGNVLDTRITNLFCV